MTLQALALLTVFASAAPAAEIRGRVVDTNGQGVGDAVVFVQELPAGMAAAVEKHPPSSIRSRRSSSPTF